MEICVNHPNRIAFSLCHGCGKSFCELCLDEGKEYYYCKNPECQKILKAELQTEILPENITCPNCHSELELSEDERSARLIHCAKCEALLDFRFNRIKVLKKENFVELHSSLNQGDIGVIQSILDDAGIEYFIAGENFSLVRPLLVPASFYVNEDNLEEAKELLKKLELNIFGVSTRRNIEE